ncbi:MAG TPA: VWA domain-containing protein, partial [Vicinamibacteria bacterium]|nr:VWA domain-containing protein [Vicinamibacteria bacterium]
MKRPRRDVEVFSLSFLDCICCGFGAIILLLTLTRMSEPQAIENAEKDLKGRIARLERELFEIRG